MAVVLRLKRFGRRNHPSYRVCVMDAHTRRDGRVIEELGFYNPVDTRDPDIHFELDAERARHWISVGARPSETVAALLKRKGVVIPPKRSRRRRLARKAQA